MAWVETQSMSFAARHGSADAGPAAALLGRLEAFRSDLGERFEATPWDTAVVLHPRATQLALAQPWVPLVRMLTAPASRRYIAGWFARDRIHVLAPRALQARASTVEGSREALALSPLHEYAHVVIGLNSPDLPPPFTARTIRAYARHTWLCEGAATHLSGQSRRLRGAVARRLREAAPPSFPPSAADAFLLGGTVFDLLEDEGRVEAGTDLATRQHPGGSGPALERAFGRGLRAAEADWRDYLEDFAAA